MKCECCKRKIGKWKNQKFCNSCSLYLRELKRKLYYYKNKSENLTILLYGYRDGRQSMHYPNELKGRFSPAVSSAYKLGKTKR